MLDSGNWMPDTGWKGRVKEIFFEVLNENT
jgi:hypothetical protein